MCTSINVFFIVIPRSTELLRLEKENKHLMKLVESLREGTPRVRELEKEIEALEDKLDDEKTQVARLTEVCLII